MMRLGRPTKDTPRKRRTEGLGYRIAERKTITSPEPPVTTTVCSLEPKRRLTPWPTLTCAMSSARPHEEALPSEFDLVAVARARLSGRVQQLQGFVEVRMNQIETEFDPILATRRNGV
jgi:hypothetical protein